ncbi:uncharacterized protein LOC106671039 [Cimex lectularius]|uniref:Uncharacterized protein n=1 Tax=Cimex lectularius TaxID=79782 RepID=A0A8I6SIG8_CIMLE|nr:uncharacterized protein LOC106671039 [Cimex lectularius]
MRQMEPNCELQPSENLELGRNKHSILLDREHSSIEQVRDAIIKVMDRDVKAVDLKFTLYKAACDKLLPKNQLDPCPPIFTTSDPMEARKIMLHYNELLPGMPFLRHYLRHPDKFEMPIEVFEIIMWLVLDLQEPDIKSVQPRYYSNIINMVAPGNNLKAPSIIFNLTFSKTSNYEFHWHRKSFQKWTKYGFYPCNMEDLHSMIYKDLIVTTNLKSQFKWNTQKVTLYTNLSYCLNKAPQSWTWGKSLIGTNIKSICIVEFIDHPGYAKKVIVSKKIKSDTGSQDIELKNYEIIHPEYARIKYILLYVYNSQTLSNQPKYRWWEGEKQFLVACTLALAFLAGCTVGRLLRGKFSSST